MNPAKLAIVRTKIFVEKHKVALAVTTTAAVTAAACLALNKRNINLTNEFLAKHGLLEEFWNTPEI